MQLLPNTEMIVYVTQRYHWLVKPLLYMYKKYFDVPLTFFSDRPIEGCNVIETFPRDMRINEEPCGKLIKDALNRIDKPVVSITVMDELPICMVDVKRFRILAEYMVENRNVARGNLSTAVENGVRKCGELLCEYSSMSILKIPYTNQHIGQIGATSLMPALWNREFLLEFIEDNWRFPSIELPGCNIFMQQDKWYSNWYSIATLPSLFTNCHICFTADKTVARISSIKNDEDRAFVAQFVPNDARIA